MGIWGPAVTVREVDQYSDPAFDMEAFFTANKLTSRKCVVEQIRDAGCYRLCVLPTESDTKWTYIQVDFFSRKQNMLGVVHVCAAQITPSWSRCLIRILKI